MAPKHPLAVVEIKAFVPARDFELSKHFYQDIGFTMASEGGGVAYFHLDHASFLLQDYCAEQMAENFMMQILVKDVEAWWARVKDSGVTEKYGVTLSDIELQPWRMRDFCLTDPSGVLWRIGQNVGELFEQGRRTVKIDNARDILRVSNADISGSEFSNAKLAGTSFENIDMARCRLNDVNLSGTAITDVNLTDVSISQANMFGMTIDGVLVTDMVAAYRAQIGKEQISVE
jgi:catechol 2,3-dioxygenase-like lactoylglutathione lyase family enzyme